MIKKPSEMIQELLDFGLNQSDIARMSGLNQPTVHRIYYGISKRPRYDSVMQIIELLDKVTRSQRKVAMKKTLGAP